MKTRSTNLEHQVGMVVNCRTWRQAGKPHGEKDVIDSRRKSRAVHFSDKEFQNLKSQIVISSWGGLRRAKPYAFTEQGVAMLSSVLRSKRAAQVNIEIMRAFVRIRQTLAAHKELDQKLKELERHLRDHDEQIQAIFEAIRQLMTPPDPPRKKIGFEVKEPGARYSQRKGKGIRATP